MNFGDATIKNSLSDQLSAFLRDLISLSGGPFLLIGDLNVDLKSHAPYVTKFCNLLHDINLVEAHNLVTRPLSHTCLDAYVWYTNDGWATIEEVATLQYSEFSDHLPV